MTISKGLEAREARTETAWREEVSRHEATKAELAAAKRRLAEAHKGHETDLANRLQVQHDALQAQHDKAAAASEREHQATYSAQQKDRDDIVRQLETCRAELIECQAGLGRHSKRDLEAVASWQEDRAALTAAFESARDDAASTRRCLEETAAELAEAQESLAEKGKSLQDATDRLAEREAAAAAEASQRALEISLLRDRTAELEATLDLREEAVCRLEASLEATQAWRDEASEVAVAMQTKWATVYMSLAEKLMAAGMRRLGNLRDESLSRVLQRLREGARLAKTARLEALKGERDGLERQMRLQQAAAASPDQSSSSPRSSPRAAPERVSRQTPGAVSKLAHLKAIEELKAEMGKQAKDALEDAEELKAAHKVVVEDLCRQIEALNIQVGVLQQASVVAAASHSPSHEELQRNLTALEARPPYP